MNPQPPVTPKPKIARIGPYEVLEELGRGSMGVVFRGFDPSIARPVAIKVIRPQNFETPAQTEEARLRFVREANAAGRLSHHNIVTVYQLGEDRGYQYLAMEFIDGTSLNKMMSPGAPMDPEIAVSILRQIADGLDYAHAQGVVHRDVKPANILIRSDRMVKIADFGIAHVSAQTLTQQGTALGTPAYMSPEQIQGLKVEGSADQFSLAVLGYQMLSGRRPFDAVSEQAMILEIMSSPPKPIRDVNPALPTRTGTVLERGMAKSPADRYSTCAEMVSALATAITEPEPEPAPVVVEPVAPPPEPPARNPRTMWIGGGIGAAGVLALAIFFLTHNSNQRPAHSPSTVNTAARPASVVSPPASPAPVPALTKPVVQAPGPAAKESRPTEPRSTPPRAVSATASEPSKSVTAEPKAPKSHAATATPAPAPLTAEQLKAKYEHDQKVAALDAHRQQLQTELIQAQSDLAALRERYKDSYPDVQTALDKVQRLRNSLNDVTNELIELKAAPSGTASR